MPSRASASNSPSRSLTTSSRPPSAGPWNRPSPTRWSLEELTQAAQTHSRFLNDSTLCSVDSSKHALGPSNAAENRPPPDRIGTGMGKIVFTKEHIEDFVNSSRWRPSPCPSLSSLLTASSLLGRLLKQFSPLVQMRVVLIDHLRRTVPKKRRHHRTRETSSQSIRGVGVPKHVRGETRQIRNFTASLDRKLA